MSDVYFFKNKLDLLLKESQAGYDKAELTVLVELLKKLVITIDDEIEQLKKKQKTAEF